MIRERSPDDDGDDPDGIPLATLAEKRPAASAMALATLDVARIFRALVTPGSDGERGASPMSRPTTADAGLEASPAGSSISRRPGRPR